MYWIAKPFVLPLQIFATITNKITFSQNCSENRRIRATLAAPVAANSGKKHVHFPTVNSNSREKCIEYIFHYCFQNSREKCIGSPNPYIYRCKFSPRLQIRLLFRKTAARIAATGATWRLPSSPIVEKKLWIPYVNSKVY